MNPPPPSLPHDVALGQRKEKSDEQNDDYDKDTKSTGPNRAFSGSSSVSDRSNVEDTRTNLRRRGYLPIENYGIVGNLRTVALCGTDGSIDFFCYPKFDSPSIFCRLLDKDKGGHFSIMPTTHTSNKQQYMPNSNILCTRFLSDHGVANIIDYMHLPEHNQRLNAKPLQPWLIRLVEVVRGEIDFNLELFPAFNYALDAHETKIVPHENLSSPDPYRDEEALNFIGKNKVEFHTKNLSMDLRWVVKCGEAQDCSDVEIKLEDRSEFGHKGQGVVGNFKLNEAQSISFIFREIPVEQTNPLPPGSYKDPIPPRADQENKRIVKQNRDPPLTLSLMDALYKQTLNFWKKWLDQSTYTGRWREYVQRSALTLKLLTYEPTGAVVAAPTFGLPEAIGGVRNWDYRYTWVRDSAFTVYAFMRLGMTGEAQAYMHFMEERCKDANEDGSLQIMYSIDGSKDLVEIELNHLDGYRGSRPVRVGNGAFDHLQLDIYGELLDGIYLYNKYGSPISYDMWVLIRRMVNYVCKNWRLPDMSIWEVRGQKQNFTYSKVMCWVAIDRGLRLSEKRMLPCPDRDEWIKNRDQIYEEVMTKCWNPKRNIFTQSYEAPDSLDSSILIMPLCFFISPSDPRFVSTLREMIRPPEKGGLVTNNLVYRYDRKLTDDGLVGEEGTFSMCGFWMIEAISRAGKYDKRFLDRALLMFEQMLGYSNHLSLFSEEIAHSGELLGNFPQAFTHIALISAAYNLDRVLSKKTSE